jgi:hypothetical protein
MIRTIRDRFGVPATCTLKGTTTPIPITVVFDRAHQEQAFEDGIVVSVTRPVATVHDADLPRPPKAGDVYVIGDTAWEVSDAQPEGCGSTRCYVTEA